MPAGDGAGRWWFAGSPDLDPFTDGFTAEAYGSRFTVPWISNVVGNLYQGGVADGLVLPERFTTVVSLHEHHSWTITPGHDPQLHASHMVDDDRAWPDMAEVHRLAVIAREGCHHGPTLVHCQAGLNRSGLVAGCALVLAGYRNEDAVDLLRRRRSPSVLSNRQFHDAVLMYRPADYA